MIEYVLRFLIGGTVVSLFALIADVLKPKGFAGLFSAAPSVALATLGLTITSKGKLYASLEAHAMIAGAVAFFLYALGCVYFIGVRHAKPKATALALLGAWMTAALGLWALWLR
jgi:uncharacterized membrane protein (GlpM family)